MKKVKKRVLFLGVGLYNYDSLLIIELSKKYDVSYIPLFPLRKEHRIKWSILSHLNRFHEINDINSKLILEKLTSLGGKPVDFVFVVKGSRLDQIHFDYINLHFPKAEKILYLWDTWSLIENKEVLLNNFSKIYTFDSEDSRCFGFKLRPLFYSNETYEFVDDVFDVSFVGTEHSNRLEKIRMIKKICKENGLSYYFRLKTTNLPFLKSRMGISPYSKDDIDIVTNKALNYQEVLSITRKSKCVVDLAHPAQCGLTMRTLETLALGRKLITTNKYIKEYSDLDSSWYLVIDNNTSAEEILRFLETPCGPINLPKRYSITSFIDELIR